MPNSKQYAKQFETIVSELEIASPCSASWSNMAETDSSGVRFCGQCSKNVYNISAMTSADAAALLMRGATTGTPPCIRFFRRHDGTIIADDCPVGLRRIREVYRQFKLTCAACLSFILLAIPAAQAKETEPKCDGTAAKTVKEITEKYDRKYSNMGRYEVSWRNVALQKPSVKKLAEEIATIRKKNILSNSERLDVLRLRLEMAQEAEKQGVPVFALEELPHVYEETSTIADSSVSSKKKDLLKEILQAQITNAKILKQSDADFELRLQKLENKKDK